MLIVQFQRSKITVCASTAKSGTNITSFPGGKVLLLITTKITTHTSNLFAFSQSLAFSQQENSFSRSKIFGWHHISAPDLKGVFFLVCFLADPIGTIQSSVAENPHHIGTFIKISWVYTQSFFDKHFPKNPSSNSLADNDGLQKNASSQTVTSSAASKGKNINIAIGGISSIDHHPQDPQHCSSTSWGRAFIPSDHTREGNLQARVSAAYWRC